MRLGKTSTDIGAFAWGCWRLGGDNVAALLHMLDTLADCGVRVIDNAAIYGYGTPHGAGHAESLLGRALRERPALREQFTIITKGGLALPTPYDSSRRALLDGCEASLRRLGVDTIDVYMIHRPDLLTAADEVAAALDTLVRSGKVRHLGVSNYAVSQVTALAAHLGHPLVCHQVELSAWQLSAFGNGVLDQSQQLGMTTMAWSPLAGGALLAGADDVSDPAMHRLQAMLDEIAGEYDVSRSEIALAFLLKTPGVLPIIGSQRPSRIRDAISAEKLALSRRDWYRIYEARVGAPMP